MEDFQYLSIVTDVKLDKDTECSGPTFYIPPQCSVCAVPFFNLLCGSCLKRGRFFLSDRQKESRSFKEVVFEFKQNNTKLSSLYKQITKLTSMKRKNDDLLQIANLEEEFLHVTMDISNFEQSILEKRQRLIRYRTDANKCFREINNVKQRQISLHGARIKLDAATRSVLSQIKNVNKDIQSLRSEKIQLLFEKFLPIKVSQISTTEPDTIAGVKVDMDSRNLAVPEPTVSSHAALTLMIIAQLALTRILNSCLPVETRKIFNLITFDANPPTRDNISHVYRVVCQLIQVLGEIFSRQTTSTVSSNYVNAIRNASDRPLLALYCLVKAIKHNNSELWTFDSPYVLSNVDIFSSIKYEMAMCPSYGNSNPQTRGIAVRVQRSREISPSPYSVRYSKEEGNSSPDSDDWDIVDEAD